MKKILREQEEEEEDVNSYWMTLRKRENTGNWITLWKLALEEALDLL
jgi:hypothetical protein